MGHLPLLEVDLLPQVPGHLVLPIHSLLADSCASSYFATLSSTFNQVRFSLVIRSASTPQLFDHKTINIFDHKTINIFEVVTHADTNCCNCHIIDIAMLLLAIVDTVVISKSLPCH